MKRFLALCAFSLPLVACSDSEPGTVFPIDSTPETLAPVTAPAMSNPVPSTGLGVTPGGPVLGLSLEVWVTVDPSYGPGVIEGAKAGDVCDGLYAAGAFQVDGATPVAGGLGPVTGGGYQYATRELSCQLNLTTSSAIGMDAVAAAAQLSFDAGEVAADPGLTFLSTGWDIVTDAFRLDAPAGYQRDALAGPDLFAPCQKVGAILSDADTRFQGLRWEPWGASVVSDDGTSAVVELSCHTQSPTGFPPGVSVSVDGPAATAYFSS